jgi:phage/plasmid-associated DNA primase
LPPSIKKNTELVEELIRDEASGILQWMLEGAWSIHERIRKKESDLPLTKTMKDRRDDLLAFSDDLDCFVKARVEYGGSASMSTEDLYEAYEAFVPTKNLPVRSYNSFSRLIGRVLHRHLKAIHTVTVNAQGSRCKGYVGIKLK